MLVYPLTPHSAGKVGPVVFSLLYMSIKDLMMISVYPLVDSVTLGLMAIVLGTGFSSRYHLFKDKLL